MAHNCAAGINGFQSQYVKLKSVEAVKTFKLQSLPYPEAKL